MSAPATLSRDVALLANSGGLGVERYTAVVDRAWDARKDRELPPAAVELLAWYEEQAVGTGKVIASWRSAALGIKRSRSTVTNANRLLREHGLILRYRRFYTDPKTGLRRDGAALVVIVGATRRVTAAVKRAKCAAVEKAAAAVRAVVDNLELAPVQPGPAMCPIPRPPSTSDKDLPLETPSPVDIRARIAGLKAEIQPCVTTPARRRGREPVPRG